MIFASGGIYDGDMKLSLFQTYKNPEIILKRQFALLALTVAVLVIGTISISVIQQIYRASRTQGATRERTAEIAELRAFGVSLNEYSMMAAKMAAATGDAAWEEKYEKSAARLNQAAEKARSLANRPAADPLIGQLTDAHEKSTNTERRALMLLGDGQIEKARFLLSGNEYETLKNNFSESLTAYLAQLDQNRTLASDADQSYLRLLIAELALLAFFLLGWLAAVNNLRQSRKVLRDRLAENKWAEEELQKNLALLKSAFEATDAGIMVVDLNNSIIAYNKHFTEIWQIPESVIRSRDNKKLINFARTQLINADEFSRATEQFDKHPEVKWRDTMFFKDGKIIERHSQPHILDGKVAGRVLSYNDVTQRLQAEKELQNSRQYYRQLFDNNPQPTWVYDFATLEILAVNDEATNRYGYSREEFLRLTIKDLRLSQDISGLITHLETIDANKPAVGVAMKHRTKYGKLIDVEIAARPITFAGRQARIVLATDVTARRQAEIALRESEYRLRTLLDNMNEGLIQVDNNHIVEFVNDRFCEMSGFQREELFGKSVFETLLDEDASKIVLEADRQRLRGISSQYEVRLRKKSGEMLWVIVGGAPIINDEGRVTGSMGVFTDINERKTIEEQMLHDTLHDGLTGLANRTLFTNRLQKAIQRGRRSDHALYAVLFLDFDRFKVINDSLGHAEGDNLLKQIARRLEKLLRGGDLLARLGGDEFTILLNELNETGDAVAIAERIQEDLNAPFILGEQEIFMTASIGITMSNDGHYRAEDMLRDADIAMYRAKAKGKAQHQIFDRTMHAHVVGRLQLETEIHHALQRGEFCLDYQPIISIENGNLAGFEALIRWNHPERGMILPGDFIVAAEENGLVIPLGRWILYESCRQLREWQKLYSRTSALTVSVNLSCKQFMQFDLAEQVTAALISTQLDPRCLRLEITETHVMENSERAVTMLNKLRRIGVGISLDDFGTGYSSLSYLHRLPVNYLKIDRSFVSRMIESRENREIVYTIVKLAQNLRMSVVAEGIETAEQFEQLKQMGCDYGQGFLISKPMPAADSAAYLGRFSETPFVSVDAPIINIELNM